MCEMVHGMITPEKNETRRRAVRAWSVSLILGGLAGLAMMLASAPASSVFAMVLFGGWVGASVAILFEHREHIRA